MVLSDSQLETLKTAIERYGVTTVRDFFGITQQSLYNVVHRKNGMSSKNLLKLEELRIAMLNNRLPSGMQKIDSNGPGVAIESPQEKSRDTAAELQLLNTWLQELSKAELTKVIAFVAGLREQQKND